MKPAPFSVLVALLVASVCGAATPPPVPGRFRGAIQLPAGQLAIAVDLALAADGAVTGEISIPALGARSVALADVALGPATTTERGASVAFCAPSVPGKPCFAGTFSADGKSVSGTVTTGGVSAPFRLRMGEGPPSLARKRLEGLDAVLEKAVVDFQVAGLAIGAIQAQEIVLARGLGFRDFARKLPVTADTLFAIGSTTKAMTATLVAMLVDEGKLGWDDPVRTYLPWFALKDPSISERLTVRDLLTHRSGLPRHDLVWYNNNEGTRRQLVERLAHLDLTADLRATFQYNNLMYAAAGYLAGEVAGTTWEELMKTRLLAPLGMTRTTLSVVDSRKDPDYALPYGANEDGTPRPIPFRRTDLVGPAGSVSSSVNEMLLWLRFNLSRGKAGDRQLVDPTTLAEVWKPQVVIGEGPTAYAHGWFVDVYQGKSRLDHGGGIDGFFTQVTLFPQADLAIVVFTNGRPGLSRWVTNVVADRVLDLPSHDWLAQGLGRLKAGKVDDEEARPKKVVARVAGTRPSHAVGDYAGDYGHPGYGVLRIEVADTRRESLTLVYNGFEVPLERWHYDVWNAGATAGGDKTFNDTKLLFRTDVSGTVAALEASFDAVSPPVVFDKRPPAKLFDPAYLGRLAGRYKLPAGTAEVTLTGKTVRMRIALGPTRTLVPQASGLFRLKEVPVVSIGFVEEGGRVVRLVLRQPGGDVEGPRIE
ncbi:MAG: D-aminopeptidase [Thermoanaerobaculia bacterium]|nr:D-aminopeptidase [Thermoanaerobaculia bacterium]